MNEAVADASVVVDVLTGATDPEALGLTGTRLHAPHLLDIEVASALRSLVRRALIESTVASRGLEALASIVPHRYSHELLLPRIWELRHALSAYDATYVALAELLGTPLVTADRRIAAASGVRCRIVVA